MTRLTCDITMSLDGFVAGRNQALDQPLGEGGEKLHEWLFGLASFRERHGKSGGEAGLDSDVLDEAFDASGAVVMGKRRSPVPERGIAGRAPDPRRTFASGRRRPALRPGRPDAAGSDAGDRIAPLTHLKFRVLKDNGEKEGAA